MTYCSTTPAAVWPSSSAPRRWWGYTPCGTRQGLAMLARGHVDLCAIHWGQAEEAHLRHPALVQQYQGHRQWVIVHGFRRVQGLVLRQGLQPKEAKEAPRLALGHASGGAGASAPCRSGCKRTRGVADPAGTYPRGQQRAGSWPLPSAVAMRTSGFWSITAGIIIVILLLLLNQWRIVKYNRNLKIKK